jgi:hypothetical protein
MAKHKPATDDLVDDMRAWVEDLGHEGQESVDLVPEIIELLPQFVKNWTVTELVAAIMDR